MSEQRRFKNQRISVWNDTIVPYTPLGQADGEEYSRDEWDVEVILTKKVKPIPVGTYALFKANPFDPIRVKREDGNWYRPDGNTAICGDNDVFARENYIPLVASSWARFDAGQDD